MIGDLRYWHGIVCTIKSRLNNAHNSNTYLYRFDFDSPIQNQAKRMFASKELPGKYFDYYAVILM